MTECFPVDIFYKFDFRFKIKACLRFFWWVTCNHRLHITRTGIVWISCKYCKDRSIHIATCPQNISPHFWCPSQQLEALVTKNFIFCIPNLCTCTTFTQSGSGNIFSIIPLSILTFLYGLARIFRENRRFDPLGLSPNSGGLTKKFPRERGVWFPDI